MATNKKPAGRRRADVDNDDPAAFNVRFDYSDAHLDNEDLDLQLEDHASLLHRERYRMCVEVNELLKKTKQSADEMLQLKNAVNSRDPYESSDRVSTSADLKRRHKLETKNSNEESSVSRDADTKIRSHKPVTEIKRTNTVDNASDKDSLVKKDQIEEINDKDGNSEETAPKPLNTLTMFLISQQNFKRNTNQQKKPEAMKPDKIASSRRKSVQLPPRPFTTRSASFHGHHFTIQEQPEKDLVDNAKPEIKYGMHVKKDHTRSRRKLEEISKLEQDSKYGYVNKKEERRKKLLAECKDTKSMEERIQRFLKGVDDFKKEVREDNSYEKVLLRSRSAQITRRNTFAW